MRTIFAFRNSSILDTNRSHEVSQNTVVTIIWDFLPQLVTMVWSAVFDLRVCLAEWMIFKSKKYDVYELDTYSFGGRGLTNTIDFFFFFVVV